MQIPIKILKAPFRIKKLIILPLVIYMVHDYSFFDSTADFVIKKGTFGIFTGFGHLQISETSGRNMTVELDSRHPLLPKTGWENEDLTLILRGKKMEIFADTSAFNAGVKENNTKTNKIITVKNRKLATQNFLFNMHINFPFGNIKRLSLLWKICLNMIL